MNPTLKRIAFVFCLWPLIVLTFAILPHRPSTAAPTNTLTYAQLQAQLHPPAYTKTATFLPMALALLGAVVMAIDAFRRDYDSPSAFALALALMGFITIGATSAVYYILWGWMPTKRNPNVRSTFCDRCVAETTERGAWSVYSHNFMGTRLIGQAQRCNECGSTIKTYWVTFLLPILPLASFRVLPIDRATATASTFISRRRPGLYWPQVAGNLLVLAAVMYLILAQTVLK